MMCVMGMLIGIKAYISYETRGNQGGTNTSRVGVRLYELSQHKHTVLLHTAHNRQTHAKVSHPS